MVKVILKYLMVLKNIKNMRDLGNYPTKSGGYTKNGTFYRSDLPKNMDDEEIEKIIKSGRELPKIAMDLIERANRNGGKDNIAVVLAQPLTGEVEQC